MKKYLTHLGSTIAIVFGILMLLSALATISSGSMSGSGFIGGLSLLFGAIAYKSAKKRRLGQSNETFMRRGIELVLCISILIIVLFQNNLKYLIATDPVPNFIIPAAAIIAYLVEVMRHRALVKGVE